jgi:hypothetical protein
MRRDKALTNESFNFLVGSSEFLNIVLNNITSCVLFLNDQMELQAYNDALKTIFSNKQDEDLLYRRCGEVIGCAYSVEEAKDCGKTSYCSGCELRVSAIESYLNDKPIFKNNIVRPFYDYNNKKTTKHLQFSTRLFRFEGEKYIMMIIDDVTCLRDLSNPDVSAN